MPLKISNIINFLHKAEMNLQKVIYLILILGLSSFRTPTNEITIIGKIYGEIPEKVEFTVPINGGCSWSFYKSIQPDSLGNFRIAIDDVDQPTMIQFRVPSKFFGTIIVEQGQGYEVKIDLRARKNKMKLLGTSKEGQELYNSLPYPDFLQLEARKFIGESSSSLITQNLDSVRDIEISTFQKLLDDGKISHEFFNFIKMDRDSYYSAIKGTVALLKFYEDKRKNNGEFSEEIERMWGEVFQKASLANPNLIRSPWFYPLLENYLNYKEYTDESFNSEKLSELYKQGLIHSHKIKQAKKYLNGNTLENFKAEYIYMACFQQKYEEELIALYSDFTKEYPKSQYTPYLEPMITPIIEFHKAQEQPFKDEIVFLENAESINSLKESVKSFKGKKVYVDVWATWCKPCIEEFEHKKELNRLLKSKDVEVLYVSIDVDEREEKWREMIKFFNLEGNHLRANKELDSDLRRIFGKNGSVTIPWYILIDEDGNIVKKHAKRPSQVKDLEKELDEI